MSEKHAFPGKTVNAVIAMKVVAMNFTDLISDLSKARTNWTPDYATTLTNRVDTVSANFLGVKARDELFKATRTLNQLIEPAKTDLSTVKKNIEVDFKGNEPALREILNTLGYKNGISVSEMAQSELVLLLLTFKRELTPDLLAQITDRGMPAEIPNRIVTYAQQINDANAIQEKLKTSTKDGTDSVIKELNDLYNEIIGICKLASDYYRKDPVKKEMFTFSKILHNIGETQAVKKDEPAATNTAK